MRTTLLAWVTVLCAGVAVAQGPPTPSFQSLGPYAAHAVSADGLVVVGVRPRQAFRWTRDGGMESLGDLPGGSLNSNAVGVSSDGSVVVGIGHSDSPDKNSYNHEQAFRWTRAGGMQDLGDLPNGRPRSKAHDVSADGAVVVGDAGGGSHAFRWTEQAGMQELGPLPGGCYSWARGISDDGTVVVGYGESPNASSGGVLAYHEAFLWRENGGMSFLGDLPGGWFASEAHAVSADGSVVVGASESGDGVRAFRWTERDGMCSLGILEGTGRSEAWAVSEDGSVIAGFCDLSVPFIWSRSHGMRNLVEILENDCGLDLSGWSSLMVFDISHDGLTLVGRGALWGNGAGWVATIPEPATLALLAVGGLLLIRRRGVPFRRLQAPWAAEGG
jgi:probable HAF family extracellular repeat protein